MSDGARRVRDQIAAWKLTVDEVMETGSSTLVFGRRGSDPVVLKVVRGRADGGDEWHAGRVLEAFGGAGTVRVLDYREGAVLLERLTPGVSLAAGGAGDDLAATEVLAAVIARMSPAAPPAGTPTVEDWGLAFERHAARGNVRIPSDLLSEARDRYMHLTASQSRPRLLHGDLHQDNVLFDAGRGWVAIDPKGVTGEPEYEIGAALRNPAGHPDLYTDPGVIERRLTCFARVLGLNAPRMLAWAFAQAVLAALWAIEDDTPPAGVRDMIRLAAAIRPMLDTEGAD